MAYCGGGNLNVSGGEAWCDYARVAEDICTVVPDANYDCTGLASVDCCHLRGRRHGTLWLRVFHSVSRRDVVLGTLTAA